jgi:glycosyltransferase involved in cell wall biosynthesis
VPSVIVAILTYRRPRQLAQVLPAVTAQTTELAGWTAQVVVVDNSPDGDAAGAVHPPVRYVHEPRPGIVAARNRALAEAAEADLLVFIDDDELPTHGWLAALVATWTQARCLAVTGPVRSVFSGDPGDWVRGCGMFVRDRHDTGAEVASAATNNLLLDLAAVRSLGLSFDDRFGRSGSEDTMFSRRIRDQGEVIRWCDEAEVVEPVPPERATRRWVLRRAFRTGTTWSAIELIRAAPGRRQLTRAELTARALVRAAQAIAQLAAATATRSTGRRSAAEVLLAGRLGMLAGAFGYLHGEYRRD